jgi:hypothetical protein
MIKFTVFFQNDIQPARWIRFYPGRSCAQGLLKMVAAGPGQIGLDGAEIGRVGDGRRDGAAGGRRGGRAANGRKGAVPKRVRLIDITFVAGNTVADIDGSPSVRAGAAET